MPRVYRLLPESQGRQRGGTFGRGHPVRRESPGGLERQAPEDGQELEPRIRGEDQRSAFGAVLQSLAESVLRGHTRVPADPSARLLGRDVLTNGASVIGQILKSLIDQRGEPPIWTNTAMDDLIVDDGRIVGARVTRDGTSLSVQARKGVLLAAGGFSRNADMRRQYSGDQPNEAKWSVSNPGDTGEVLHTAMRLGAKADLLDEAWWLPTVFVADPRARAVGQARRRPAAIYVDGTGR